MVKRDFLIDETLDSGRYRIDRHLLGQAGLRLYLAEEAGSSEGHHLVSVIHNPHGIPIHDIERELLYRHPGSCELTHIGRFDRSSADVTSEPFVEVYWAMVEKIPRGSWLPDILIGAIPHSEAAGLALSVGEILLAAAREGVFHFSLRPESLWVCKQHGTLTATALSTRCSVFFKHRRASVGQIFERGYGALEVSRGKPHGSSSLTFPLATMMVEWLTGRRPFPAVWHGNPSAQVEDRAHESLDVSPPLRQLLRRGLTEDAAQRLALEPFLAELREISAMEQGPAPL